MSIDLVVDKHVNREAKTVYDVQNLVFWLSTAFDLYRDPILGLHKPFKAGKVARVKFSSNLPGTSDAVIDTNTPDPVASNSQTARVFQ